MSPWATNAYPKVLYSTSRSVQAEYPAVVLDPTFQEVGQDAISQSGRRVSYTYRREEQRAIGFLGVGTVELGQWHQFFRDWGGQGRQFELLIDRYTAGLFTFENTWADQNGAAFTWAHGPLYTTVYSKTALVCSGADMSALWLTNKPGSWSSQLDVAAGTIVMTLIPDRVSNTGSQFFLLTIEAAYGQCMQLYKSNSNRITFQANWADGHTAMVHWATASWGAAGGAPITIIADYSLTNSVRLWYNTNQATYSEVATEISSFTTFNNTIAIGRSWTGSGPFPMRLMHLAFYKTIYEDPTVLASWFPVGRTYYDKAELIERAWQPRRVGESTDAWQWTWQVRQGV